MVKRLPRGSYTSGLIEPLLSEDLHPAPLTARSLTIRGEVVMSSGDIKKTIYRDCRTHTGLNKRQWGRLFALGNRKNTDQVVSHKENTEQPGKGTTSKGVNMPEALASQLLSFIHDQGFDIANIEFDDKGKIKNIPTRANPCTHTT